MNERTRHILAMLSLAMGFLVLMVEVRYEHRNELADHPIALVPIIFSAVAALMCFLAMGNKAVIRYIAAIVMACGVVVGVLGLREHTFGDFSRSLKVLQPFGISAGETQVRQGEGEEGEDWRPRRRPEGGGPPVLAPLSMAGLGILGAVLAWPKPSRKREG